MPKAKKMGRPKLPKGHAKALIVPVRVNAEDRKPFEKAAKADGQDFIRLDTTHTEASG